MERAAFPVAWAALVIVTGLGSVLDVMEVDAAQYAAMSRDMLESDTWLLLHHRGQDYLDKPPLLFWLSALSFQLFGVHNWSYKLPSILFAFLGVYATWRFARLHHAREVAHAAALMFGGSAAFVLMTNDVRTDTLLTGSVITATWLGMAWVEQRRWGQLIGAAVFIASGMLAKGPMGLVAPVLAVCGHVLLARKWAVLRDPRLLVLPVVVALLLLPMCIGLYEQHGMHGLRFYFWEQSFGRITGGNRWKDDSTVLFFTHELPWLVLPWTLFMLAGVWQGMRAVVLRRALPEYASLVGGLGVFAALSLSQFKLPHYLYVVLPLFAVLAARGWHGAGRALHAAQLVLVLLLAVLGAVLVGGAFPDGGIPFVALISAVALAGGVTLWRVGMQRASLPLGFALFMAVAVGLNAHVYPRILAYQANARVGRTFAREGLDATRAYGLQRSGTALDFYAGFHVPWLSNAGEAARVVRPGVVIWTDAERLQELRQAGLEPRSITPVPDYPVQLLSLEFLMPASRGTVVKERYLLRY